VFIRVRRIGRTSLTSAFAVYRVDDDALMCEAEQTLVFVHLGERRPVAVPEAYRTPIRDFEGAYLEEAPA
jgi:acyl-CoA thioesterase FadM